MFCIYWHKKILLYSTIVIFCIASLLKMSSMTFAKDDAPYMRLVRIIEADYQGIANPAGLTFSPKNKTFLIVTDTRASSPQDEGSDVAMITLVEDPADSVRVPRRITDPINMTFDTKANRLLILQSNTRNLFAIAANSDSNLDTKKVTRYDAQVFDLQDPQGMTSNTDNGDLFILDSAMKRIVRIVPGTDQSFDDPTISYIDLKHKDIADPKGIAFSPNNSHLYLLSPTQQKLYEFNQTGQFISVRDLSEFELKNPQGMVFALSGDFTSDRSKMSLYIADSNLDAGQNQNIRSLTSAQASGKRTRDKQFVGEILELSLNRPVSLTKSTK